MNDLLTRVVTALDSIGEKSFDPWAKNLARDVAAMARRETQSALDRAETAEVTLRRAQGAGKALIGDMAERLAAAEARAAAYEQALRKAREKVDEARHEIGVPGDGYPASIANAYWLLMDALGISAGVLAAAEETKA